MRESFGRIKYDSFDFDLIGKYFRNKNNSSAFQVLSDKTCNDLDFEDLYMFLDRTTSKVGQQYLYNKLRTIEVDEIQSKINEEIISELSKDSVLRIAIQRRLEKLNHKDTFYLTALFKRNI